MPGPGSGRYTTYVPKASDPNAARNALLRRLFNAKAQDDRGVFYGSIDQTNNTDAAAAAVARATANVDGEGRGGLFPANGIQAGDLSMFPQGVNLIFGEAPDTADVVWSKAGDPSNPFVPDLTSPGPGLTGPLDRDTNPQISVEDLKGPSYIPGAPGTGTKSPSVTSPVLGQSALGGNLVPGKSAV